MILFHFYFVFKWVQRIKLFKWCSKFLLNDSFIWVVKIFKQQVLCPKVYSKEFSSHNLHSKGFTKVYKIPPQLDQKSNNHSFCLCCHQGIFVPKMAIEIGSYISLSSSCKIISRHQFLVNITLFLFCLLTLLQSAKCHSRSGMPITRCHALL
jgi:hypothetical protein